MFLGKGGEVTHHVSFEILQVIVRPDELVAEILDYVLRVRTLLVQNGDDLQVVMVFDESAKLVLEYKRELLRVNEFAL